MSTPSSDPAAPKEWRGRFYEDLDVGDVFRSRLGPHGDRDRQRLVHVPDAEHEPDALQRRVRKRHALRERPLVNSAFTLALVAGLSVPDTSENATANLGWTDIKLPNPVFVGDTLWAETRGPRLRESARARTSGSSASARRGINQRREVVIEFRRSFMIYKRDAPEVADPFPGTDADWTV